jgi:uncharacterized protein GlcG (DUF336 family)
VATPSLIWEATVAVSQISASGFSRNALMVGGAVPVEASNEIVGAIGVSGSLGSVYDEEMSDAGDCQNRGELIWIGHDLYWHF